MIDHWIRLGRVVYDERTRRGWSQHELAARAGVARSWLARVEQGHRGVSLEPLLRLLAALDLTLTVHDAPDLSRELTPSPDIHDTSRHRALRASASARAAAWAALPSATPS
ncbi:MAG: helix-turn-helix transcriptional regulator [Mobilicoccus sp.]|nr:helix-turn-helix transcriptional regulator [Mobilicoccus sp.]